MEEGGHHHHLSRSDKEECFKNVFKYLTVPDLKIVRLVSKEWMEASLDAWRKAAVIVLTATPQCGVISSLLPYKSLLQLSIDGADNSFQLKEKPFSSYKLIRWNLDRTRSQEELKFIADYGPHIKYLHFESCDFDTFENFDDVISRRLPKLRTLVWSNNSFKNDKELGDPFTGSNAEDDSIFSNFVDLLVEKHAQRTYFQRSLKVFEFKMWGKDFEPWCSGYWTRFLYCMPNIEEITVRVAEATLIPENWLVNLPTALKETTRLHQVSKLRKLDIMNLCEGANAGCAFDFDRLATQPFMLPLESLAVDLGHESVAVMTRDWPDPAGISRMLEGCCNCYGEEQLPQPPASKPLLDARTGKVLEELRETLQVLKLFRGAPKDHLHEMPLAIKMDSLRELYLYGNVAQNLSFLRFTPSLKILVLRQLSLEKRVKLESADRLHLITADPVTSTVEELSRKNVASNTMRISSLEYLELDFKLGGDSLSTLAEWLPNVRSVKFVLDDDSLSATCYSWSKLEELECLFGSKVDRRGISCLSQCSELRKFKLSAACGHGSLNSSSVAYFLPLGNLQELNICVSAEFNEDSEAQLLEQIGVVKLIRAHKEDRGEECCEWRKVLQNKPELRRFFSE